MKSRAALPGSCPWAPGIWRPHDLGCEEAALLGVEGELQTRDVEPRGVLRHNQTRSAEPQASLLGSGVPCPFCGVSRAGASSSLAAPLHSSLHFVLF